MLETIPLPQEIYELFVDTLADASDPQNTAALFQCSRVSRLFWLRARRHTFANIEFRHSGSHQRATTLQRFQSFLAFATTSVSSALPVIGLVRSCFVQARSPYDIWNYRAFPELLKLFISSEAFSSLKLDVVDGSWSDVSAHTAALIHTLIRTPHLKSLSLRGFRNIPPELLDGSTVKNLILYSCFSTNSANIKPLSTLARPPPLESIQTDNELPVLSNPPQDGLVPFPHLKHVAITISQPAHLDIACNLAWGSSQSLCSLGLIFIYCVYLPSPARPVSLAQFPNLRHIRLGFSTDPGIMTSGTAYLKELCQYISRPPDMEGPLPLECIELEITLPHDIHRSAPVFNKDHWRALDKAITRPYLAHVRRVKLSLHFLVVGMFIRSGFAESTFVANTLELIKPLFSRVDNTKGIHFSIDVKTDFVGRGFLPDF